MSCFEARPGDPRFTFSFRLSGSPRHHFRISLNVNYKSYLYLATCPVRRNLTNAVSLCIALEKNAVCQIAYPTRSRHYYPVVFAVSIVGMARHISSFIFAFYSVLLFAFASSLQDCNFKRADSSYHVYSLRCNAGFSS